jgi:gamma-glutamyltranspeptidase/glutathione hydrolase
MAGEVWRNPALAATFEALGAGGSAAFYGRDGTIAPAIVNAVQERGGVMTVEDLETHSTEWPAAISTVYGEGRVRVFECPPNGQGITALIALNIVEAACAAIRADGGAAAASTGAARRGSVLGEMSDAERLHVLLCAMRLAFADARRYIADPAVAEVPVPELLSKAYAAKRAELIPPFGSDATTTVSGEVKHGSPVAGSDTVSFQVVDSAGNGIAFINSNYMGFGSHVEPAGTGFTLQNRGANLVLDKGHPNCVGPSKRPYHTIIPCIATLTHDEPPAAAAAAAGGKSEGFAAGSLLFTASVMGGFMQPVGHVLVITNMLDRGMDPQTALDQPRFCIASGEGGGEAFLEDGISEEAAAALAARGHNLGRGTDGGSCVTSWDRSLFGRGQIIWVDHAGTLWGGSDGRGDGAAVGGT